jgi:hypothetical protein
VLTDKAIGRITAAAQKIEGVKDVLLTTPNPQKNMINPFHNIH